MARAKKAVRVLEKNRKKKQKEREEARLEFVPKYQKETLSLRIDSTDTGDDKTSEDILDDRNVVEKALNLEQDQNVIKDVFEILDRPQKALFGGMRSAIDGDNIAEGALEGLTGENKQGFRSVLSSLGADEEHILTRIGGVAGDIIIDPMKWIKFGGDSKKVYDILTDATLRTSEAVDKAEEAIAASKSVMMSEEEVAKLYKNLKDAKNEHEQYKEALNELRQAKTASGWVFEGMKRGVTGAARTVDGFVNSVLSKIDKLRETRYINADLVREADKMKKLSDSYSSFKDEITSKFNIYKHLPEGTLAETQKIQGQKELAMNKISQRYKILTEKINTFGETSGMGAENVDKAIMQMEEYINYNVDSFTLDTLIAGNLLTNVGVSEEDVTVIEGLLKETIGEDVYKSLVGDNLFTIRHHTDSGGIFVANPRKINSMREILRSSRDDMQELAVKLSEVSTKVKPLYTPEHIEYFETLKKDDAFMSLYFEAREIQTEMMLDIDRAMDTSIYKNMVDGYVRHAKTEDFKRFVEHSKYDVLMKYMGKSREEVPATFATMFSGNTALLKDRHLPTSATEANMLFKLDMERILRNDKLPEDLRKYVEEYKDIDMFEEMFTRALDSYIVDVPDAAEKLRILETTLVASTLTKGDYIRPYPEHGKIQYGFVPISFKDLEEKLERGSAFLSDDKETLKKVMDTLRQEHGKADKLLIQENVQRMIGVATDDKHRIEKSGLLNILDAATNMFKTMKLSNLVGTQVRNVFGNHTNLVLAGMPNNEIIHYGQKATEIMTKADEALMKQIKGEVLTGKELDILEQYNDFVKQGFTRELSRKMLESTESYQIYFKKQEEARLLGKEFTDKFSLAKASTQMNAYMDDVYRFSAFMYAKDNPESYLSLGLDSPAAYARYAMFDPDALTPFERNVMRKIIPFYTFAKMNLQFQLKNIVNNTDKYRALNRFIDSSWDAATEDSETQVEDFKNENMWIPLFKIDDDGKYYAVKANLPPSDFFQMFDRPSQEMLSKLSPAIKSPIELATNRDFFSGREIEEFKGQKDYQMPEFSAKQAYLMRQTGLDVPIKMGYDVYSTVAKPEEDNTAFDHAVDAVFNPILNRGHAERAERRKQYQELDKLKATQQKYAQDGIYLRTLREIRDKKANRNLKRVIEELHKRNRRAMR